MVKNKKERPSAVGEHENTRANEAFKTYKQIDGEKKIVRPNNNMNQVHDTFHDKKIFRLPCTQHCPRRKD